VDQVESAVQALMVGLVAAAVVVLVVVLVARLGLHRVELVIDLQERLLVLEPVAEVELESELLHQTIQSSAPQIHIPLKSKLIPRNNLHSLCGKIDLTVCFYIAETQQPVIGSLRAIVQS
jgi:hypothetical protein